MLYALELGYQRSMTNGIFPYHDAIIEMILTVRQEVPFL